MTTASRSRNGNGNGRSRDALAGLRNVERRRLKSGAPAHNFTTEERRRGAQRTNEIKRERAAKRRETEAEPLDLAEKLYLLKADNMLVLQAFNRLSQELSCSDCRRALVAVELVLKYLVRPRLPKEPGLGAAAITIMDCPVGLRPISGGYSWLSLFGNQAGVSILSSRRSQSQQGWTVDAHNGSGENLLLYPIAYCAPGVGA